MDNLSVRQLNNLADGYPKNAELQRDKDMTILLARRNSALLAYSSKEILQDTRFVCEVESSNKKVRVFKYETKESKARYAVWCPSSNSTQVKRFKLNVGEGEFILAELAFEKYNGKRSDLKNKDGNVTFCASEMPVFVIEK